MGAQDVDSEDEIFENGAELKLGNKPAQGFVGPRGANTIRQSKKQLLNGKGNSTVAKNTRQESIART